MLMVESHVTVPGLTGAEITGFLSEPNDAAYQAWWPGVHLQFHRLSAGGADHVGDTVYMDEFVGRRRIRMAGHVVDVEPGRRIVWQMQKVVRLPVRLALTLTDGADGVTIRHTISAGWAGVGSVLDPLFGLYFTSSFATAMDAHVRAEFTRLRDLLHPTGDRER